MKRYTPLLLIVSAVSCGTDSTPNGPSGPAPSFFVTSATSPTGNLGGLAGADATCQRLAGQVGQGARSWRAYLSVESTAGTTGHAKDRIGSGPWYNANTVLVANNLAELHAKTGDAALFLDERGQRINGQWTGSPSPVEHDILTGSNADGTVATGLTCRDWTSAAADVAAQVGHSDGLGPNQNSAGALSSWNASHTNLNCADTAPRGALAGFIASLPDHKPPGLLISGTSEMHFGGCRQP